MQSLRARQSEWCGTTLKRARALISPVASNSERCSYQVGRPWALRDKYLSLFRSNNYIFSRCIFVARARYLPRTVMQSSAARGRARQVSHIFHFAPSNALSSASSEFVRRELSRCSTPVKFLTDPTFAFLTPSRDARCPQTAILRLPCLLIKKIHQKEI